MTETTVSTRDDGEMAVRYAVERIVKWLVDAPDEVLVVRRQVGEDAVLDVRVAPGDVGIVIGRQGRTARSLRTIIAGMNCKHGVRVSLNVLDVSCADGERGKADA